MMLRLPLFCQVKKLTSQFIAFYISKISVIFQGNVGSPLTALDTSLDGFCHDLEILDNMSSRTCDTVHVFYVRAAQKTAEEILSNVVSYSVTF